MLCQAACMRADRDSGGLALPISICPTCKVHQVKLGGYLCQACEDKMTGRASSRSRPSPGPSKSAGPPPASNTSPPSWSAPKTPPRPATDTPKPQSAGPPARPFNKLFTTIGAVGVAFLLIAVVANISSQMRANRQASEIAVQRHQQYLQTEAALQTPPPAPTAAPPPLVLGNTDTYTGGAVDRTGNGQPAPVPDPQPSYASGSTPWSPPPLLSPPPPIDNIPAPMPQKTTPQGLSDAERHALEEQDGQLQQQYDSLEAQRGRLDYGPDNAQISSIRQQEELLESQAAVNKARLNANQ